MNVRNPSGTRGIWASTGGSPGSFSCLHSGGPYHGYSFTAAFVMTPWPPLAPVLPLKMPLRLKPGPSAEKRSPPPLSPLPYSLRISPVGSTHSHPKILRPYPLVDTMVWEHSWWQQEEAMTPALYPTPILPVKRPYLAASIWRR